MKISKLCLENFRNIKQMELHPHDNINVIYGDNAQGKTNILEAVWLFSGARSFRGAKDSELIHFEEDISRLSMDFMAEERPQTASLTFGKAGILNEGRKQTFLNEIKQSGQSKLAGVFCTVLFSPDHLLLVKQGPEHRRRMIDQSLCQAYPKYAKILDTYQKILKQRASLLRDIPRSGALLDMLDVWDKSFVDYGAYITAVRARYVRRLARAAGEIYGGISREKEQLTVQYRLSFGPEQESCDNYTREDYKQALEQALKDCRREDIAQGHSTIGPHRDDMEIAINGNSARSFGSQGQQRSVVLALKLAECAILKERNGEPPVILLDDVMSELDEARRHYLLNYLKDEQILITCCDAALFAGLEKGSVFRVENGVLAAQ